MEKTPRWARKVEVGDLWKLRGAWGNPDQYFLVLQVYVDGGMYVGTSSMKIDCGTVCNVYVNADPTIWDKEA